MASKNALRQRARVWPYQCADLEKEDIVLLPWANPLVRADDTYRLQYGFCGADNDNVALIDARCLGGGQSKAQRPSVCPT
jgi:hypothetical protein